jgi:hypothetical protein
VRLTSRLRAQDGFAIPIAIWMLTLGLLFGGLAMSQALLGFQRSNESWNSTRAHAAAEAAARMAIYRVNTLGLNGASVTHLTSTLDWTQCAVQTTAADNSVIVGTATIGVGKSWCDPVSIDLGGGATATFQLSSIVNCNVELGYNPLPTLLSAGTIRDCLKRKIVATGTAGGVTRRIYEETRATASANVVGALGVNLISSVTLQPATLVPGTLRECTPKGGTSSNPAAGC